MNARVTTEIVRIANLAADERAAMECLYNAYYVGAQPETFAHDLAQKDLAILLKKDGAICGFSTLVVYPFADMRILFSGDTVVDVACRNQVGLAGAFGHVMARLNAEPGAPLFWFLICKGARTYRFLPTFFNRFVPGERADVDLATRLRRVAGDRFPREYNATTGVLHFDAAKDRLRDDVLRVDAESVRFRTLNPNWRTGDELCCFVPLAMDNLNRLGQRVIAETDPVWRL